MSDLALFLEIARSGSVREVSRLSSLSPGQVSKRLSRLEERLGQRLFERSTRGVRLTPVGRRFAIQSEYILQRFEMTLKSPRARPESAPKVVIGAAGFLHSHLVAPALAGESLLVRHIDVAPRDLIAQGLRATFEIAVHLGQLDWPGSWHSEMIGSVDWRPYVRRGHPLSERTREVKVLGYAFVVPEYLTPRGLRRGPDHCPIPSRKRLVQATTSSAHAAARILLRSDLVAFLPDLVARPFGNDLRALKVKEWPVVRVPVYLSVRAQSVRQDVFRALKHHLKTELSRV